MDTATLKLILLEELWKYTGEGLNDSAYLTVDEAQQVYAIIDIAQIRGRRVVGLVLVVRLQNQQIFIELDLHDKLLRDALIARGVPSAQIIPTYDTSTAPTST